MAANQVPDDVPIVLPAEVPGINEATAVRDQDEANVNVPDIIEAPQAHHPAQPGEVCICLITMFCSLWFDFSLGWGRAIYAVLPHSPHEYILQGTFYLIK
jgi:hypothetical protein